MNDQIKNLSKQIEAAFLTKIKGVTLSPSEAALVERATIRIAEQQILGLGATPEQQKELTMIAGMSIASLANIGAAKGVRAESAIREAALQVVATGVHILIAALIAA